MTDARLAAAVAEAFRPYEDTLCLLDDLARQRRYVYEFVLLVCARLDALANLGRGGSTRENFVQFVRRHASKRKVLGKVSVPDLAGQILGYLWVVPGTIPKPGRLELLTETDAPLIEVIENSGLPITEEEVAEFLSFVLAALQSSFRIGPRQPKRKPSLVASAVVVSEIEAYAKSYRRGRYETAVKAIGPLVREASTARLLYRNYRSAVIHEHGFEVDERGFHRNTSPYWRTIYRHPLTQLPPGLELQFPGKFLRELLHSCLTSYQLELIHRRKLPITLFFELFDLDDSQYLDEETIPDGRTIGFRSRRQ